MAQPGVMISHQHGAVVLPWRGDLAALFPKAPVLRHHSGALLALPHHVDTVRVLRNHGVDAPSPVLSRYDWAGGQPWGIQRDTAALLTTSPRAYVLSDMGTGKTRSVLYAVDYLIKSKAVRKALVVAPLSTLNVVWGAEIFKHFPHLKSRVLHGEKAKRLKRLAEDVDIYIVNHDGAATVLHELKARGDIDLVIFDEAAVYRNARTDRWKTAQALITGRKYVWALTGSPTPTAPTDAWGLAKLVTPERVPKYFGAFRDATMLKVSQFRYVPRADATERAHSALKPSVRFSRDDVQELPPTTYVERECAMSPEAKQLHDGLIAKLRVLRAEGSITAANAGVLVNKLQQILTGWVYLDNGTVMAVPCASRLAALDGLFDETAGKLLVFTPYVHSVKGIADYLRTRGHDVAEVHGGVGSTQRDGIFNVFQNTTGLRAIVAHPACMAHGLTLTAANTTAWWGCPPGFEIYEQANARTTRPGQKRATLIAHLIGAPIERKLYANIRRLDGQQKALLDMLDGVQDDR